MDQIYVNGKTLSTSYSSHFQPAQNAPDYSQYYANQQYYHNYYRPPITPVHPMPYTAQLNQQAYTAQFNQPAYNVHNYPVYPSPYNYPQQFGQKRKSTFNHASNKYQRTSVLSFKCDPCERHFAQERQYREHVAAHKKCTVCGFTASKAVLKSHEEHEHGILNGTKFITKKESPEEIQKWIEQRKSKYPTDANIAKKNREIEEKIARGEIEPVANKPRKQKPCRNYAKGRCNRGENCRFAHVEGSLKKGDVHKRMNLFRSLAVAVEEAPNVAPAVEIPLEVAEHASTESEDECSSDSSSEASSDKETSDSEEEGEIKE